MKSSAILLTVTTLMLSQVTFAAGVWVPAHTNPDGTYVPGHFEGNTDGAVVVPVDGNPVGDGQRHIVPSEARNYLPHNSDAGAADAGGLNRENGLQDRGSAARGHRR